MLKADEATQTGDREHEMIDDRFILDDEIGYIMRSRNATVGQLRRQEDDLENALKKLEEQDRLVSLGLLSTSVAHELNTPLAVLQGSIEKLLETRHDGPTLERLARMLRVTQRLRKISEGLVDFARVRKESTEPLVLRDLIDESWNLVAIDEKASAVNFMNDVQSERRGDWQCRSACAGVCEPAAQRAHGCAGGRGDSCRIASDAAWKPELGGVYGDGQWARVFPLMCCRKCLRLLLQHGWTRVERGWD